MTRISIVIPAYNEEGNLPNLFRSISEQVLPGHLVISDVIIVDNGSTDKTLAIAREFCSGVYSRPGDAISALRNYGAARSSGNILIFVDADGVIGRDALGVVASLLGGENIAAVGPDGLVPLGTPTWVQKAWYSHTKRLSGTDQAMEVETLGSGFLAIRRSAYDLVGGFDSRLTIGEDTDISRKLRSNGYKLLRSGKLLVYNSGHPGTLVKFMRREYWHGDSLRHLVMHKGIDLLTAYFFVNLMFVLIAVAFLFFNSVMWFVAVLGVACVAPMAKAAAKARKLDSFFLKLFILYFLYVNCRSAALFKNK
jgi:glycosyltransferase involved in cell wall biosynthesis